MKKSNTIQLGKVRVTYSKKYVSPFARKAEKALKEAVKQAMIEHKLSGDPIVVWKNGKVVWIPAEKIPVRIPKNKLRKLKAVLKSEKVSSTGSKRDRH